ncbi:RNA polymerase sigma factor [Calidifontibacter sp. DB0510]|uniref:RNA polymerase sigma factor n=1 Tax=Metallococcus carri TaxID=1656884 RepID=A0A967B2M6_9MICO|nr:RNA polymerase sigma factor [Metallococcus carri]NHN56887.1 RNA polymerase sigma factor [Metallococcus carri]NOP37632.1 RNA polymerase sigma factor [Calidifontibacter sp. DB2511S]
MGSTRIVVAREDSVETAVRQVYDAHFGRLVGWATPLLSDRDLAHDLATEAFVKLLRHWESVDDPRAWLYTTVANQVRDHWRRRGREAAAYGRWSGGRIDPEPVAPATDHATRLTVRDAVESLPERLRLPVLLHYYADLTVAQVATQLGKSDGAVKRDLFDARKQLAARLEGT